MDAVSTTTAAFTTPWSDRRAVVTGLLSAAGLALAYSLIVGLSSQSWSHLLAQWRIDALFITLVAVGFGTQMGLYRHVRSILRGDGRTVAVTAGSTATSTTAMVACCLHHLSDIVPFIGLSGAAAFLIQYKVPVVLLSLAANGIGIALMLRTLRHTRRATQPACH